VAMPSGLVGPSIKRARTQAEETYWCYCKACVEANLPFIRKGRAISTSYSRKTVYNHKNAHGAFFPPAITPSYVKTSEREEYVNDVNTWNNYLRGKAEMNTNDTQHGSRCISVYAIQSLYS
jgi:hypothetical protein